MIDLDTYEPQPGDSFSLDQQMIDATSAMGGWKPDETWRFTDTNGHTHYWKDGYPTLTRHEEPDYTAHDPDGYPEEYLGDSWYECAVCGEVIEPTMIHIPPDVYKRYIPGLITATLISDGVSYNLTREQYKRLSQIVAEP